MLSTYPIVILGFFAIELFGLNEVAIVGLIVFKVWLEVVPLKYWTQMTV